MGTVVLLGDSIFDNGAYVDPGAPDVRTQLARKLEPHGWSVDFRAIDGATTTSVLGQLNRPLPKPCTIVLSVGGNDALDHIGLLDENRGVRSFAEVLDTFYEIREVFRRRYRELLEATLGEGQPLVVCTVYNPSFPDPGLQKAAEAGLSFFNDVIAQEAIARGLPVIDLREVCADPGAFANPVEPSQLGGELITDAILRKLAIE